MKSVSNARKLATWHTTVHTLDVLIATIIDMLQWIALTRYLLQACQHNAAITPLVDMTGQHLRTATPDILTATIETGIDSADLNPTHTTPYIEVTVVVIPAEAILDHFIDPHTRAPCVTEVPAHTTYCCHTPHHRSSSHRHLSRGDSRFRTHKSSRQHYKPTQRPLPVHKQCLGNIRTEGTNRSQLTILSQNIIAQMNRIVTQRMI